MHRKLQYEGSDGITGVCFVKAGENKAEVNSGDIAISDQSYSLFNSPKETFPENKKNET